MLSTEKQRNAAATALSKALSLIAIRSAKPPNIQSKAGQGKGASVQNCTSFPRYTMRFDPEDCDSFRITVQSGADCFDRGSG